MPRTFLSLVLMAVHVSVMVDSKPWHLNRALQNTLTHPAQSQPSLAPRHTEPKASLRTNKWPDFLVILPVKTHSSNFVSIFDLRRKRFLCMDQEGELFNSRQRNTMDCLFQRLWLDLPSKRDIFYSSRAARLLKFQGVDFSITKEESSGMPADIRDKLLKRILKRQKRSEEINPSDPLRTEPHPPHPANAQKEPDQPNRDQTGAVSKETIASCYDPLKVLQTNGQVSPIKNNIGQISHISPILADQAEDDRHAQTFRDAQPMKKGTSLLLPPLEHSHVP